MKYLNAIENTFARYKKAVMAFLIPAVTLLYPVMADGDLPTTKNLVAAVVVCVATSFGVAVAGNRQAEG